MSGNRKPDYIALLECGHNKEGWREFGATTYCLYCQAEKRITKSMPQFHISCLGCRYARSTGSAEFAARRLADRHGRRYPHHGLQIYRGSILWEDRRPYSDVRTYELPFSPPF